MTFSSTHLLTRTPPTSFLVSAPPPHCSLSLPSLPASLARTPSPSSITKTPPPSLSPWLHPSHQPLNLDHGHAWAHLSLRPAVPQMTFMFSYRMLLTRPLSMAPGISASRASNTSRCVKSSCVGGIQLQSGWRLAQTSPADPLGSVTLVKEETTGVSQMRRRPPLKIILKNQNDYNFTTLQGNSPRNQP